MNLKLTKDEVATALLGLPACSNDQAMNGIYHRHASDRLLDVQASKMWLIAEWLKSKSLSLQEDQLLWKAGVVEGIAEELADMLTEQGIPKG